MPAQRLGFCDPPSPEQTTLDPDGFVCPPNPDPTDLEWEARHRFAWELKQKILANPPPPLVMPATMEELVAPKQQPGVEYNERGPQAGLRGIHAIRGTGGRRANLHLPPQPQFQRTLTPRPRVWAPDHDVDLAVERVARLYRGMVEAELGQVSRSMEAARPLRSRNANQYREAVQHLLAQHIAPVSWMVYSLETYQAIMRDRRAMPSFAWMFSMQRVQGLELVRCVEDEQSGVLGEVRCWGARQRELMKRWFDMQRWAWAQEPYVPTADQIIRRTFPEGLDCWTRACDVEAMRVRTIVRGWASRDVWCWTPNRIEPMLDRALGYGAGDLHIGDQEPA